jgi:hypothetical protein
MKDYEFRLMQTITKDINEHFDLETEGGFFVLRPYPKLRKELGLDDNATFLLTTLESAGSFVTGFMTALFYVRTRDTKRRPFKGAKSKGSAK